MPGAVRVGIIESTSGPVTIHIGAPPEGTVMPLLCAAEDGFSALGDEIAHPGWAREHVGAIHRLAHRRMRETFYGPVAASVDLEGGRRRLLLLQSNRSEWYSKSAPDPEGAWQDFYATGVRVLLDLAMREGALALEVVHPTGHGWLPGLARAVLHALRVGPSPSDVYVSRCCMGDSDGGIGEALGDVSAEPIDSVPRRICAEGGVTLVRFRVGAFPTV